MKNSEIIELTSNKPGPTIAIIGGIHGDEICGIKAIEKLKEELKIIKGKIILTNMIVFQGGGTDNHMNKQEKIGRRIECGWTKELIKEFEYKTKKNLT